MSQCGSGNWRCKTCLKSMSSRFVPTTMFTLREARYTFATDGCQIVKCWSATAFVWRTTSKQYVHQATTWRNWLWLQIPLLHLTKVLQHWDWRRCSKREPKCLIPPLQNLLIKIQQKDFEARKILSFSVKKRWNRHCDWESISLTRAYQSTKVEGHLRRLLKLIPYPSKTNWLWW
jgi:hypothetical protein